MVVDVHGHITHPELFKLLPMPPALADIGGMLEQKAKAGIDVTIVGSPVGFGTMVPVEGMDNFDQPLDRLESFHDWLAETVSDHAPHLSAYAYTNPFGDEAMLAQTAQTVRDGPFVGLIVNTSVRGEYLDSPGADAFFAMAEELDVPVFLHPPAEPVGTASYAAFGLVEQVARFCDVTACLATLVFSGRLERHPRLRLLAAMAGGAIGLLGERLDTADRMRMRGGPPGSGPPGGGGPPPEAGASPPPSEQLRRIYVDTATSSRHALEADLDVLGAGRMMLGTDSPPASKPLEVSLQDVRELQLSEPERDAVLGATAADLFRLAPAVQPG